MKVLHVAPSFARRDGGPSETLRGLIPELERLGVEVRVATTDKGLDTSDQAFIADHEVIIVRSRRPYSWTFAPSLPRLLVREILNADVVHIHSVHTFPSSVAMTLCRALKRPYLVEPHGALDYYHLRQGHTKKMLYTRLIDRYGWRRVTAAIYSSERESEEGRRALAAPSVVMPLGVDESLFTIDREPDESTTPGNPRILFLGRLTNKKRLDLVLKAMATPPLDKQSATLSVAGPMDPELNFSPEILVRQLGIERRVTFLGPVSGTERRDLMRTHDVFVLPSEDESFGVALSEALAAGLACVATPMTGFAPEAAKAGALKLTELHAASISESIATAFQERQALSAEGRRYAQLRHRWGASAALLLQAYEAVLSGENVHADLADQA